MKSSARSSGVPLAWQLWLSLGVWAGLGTLGLSLIRQSHALAWWLWLLPGIVWSFLVVVRDRKRSPNSRAPRWFWARCFRWGASRWFLLLALAAGVGGALYEPTNWDTQWYRIPRVLHWLAERQWHFIPSVEGRLNYVAPGLEWLWTPLVAWTGSDRFLFLPNLASFFLLPGAAWALFCELEVPRRVAWWAMWLLPAAWIYCFQAGSAANDAISAPYLLMAVALALRALRTADSVSLLWSVIAAGLFSNVKQSNLPLGLLWFVPAVAAGRLWVRLPVPTVATVVAATAVSFVPVTLMNLRQTGHWMGWSRAEQIWVPDHHFVALVANSVLAWQQTFAPPLIPWADAWNTMMRRLVTGTFAPYLRGFEDFGILPRAIGETWAGLGLPFGVLWFSGWLAARRGPLRKDSSFLVKWTRRLSWPLLLFFLSQTGTVQLSRYLASYYPFLLASFLGVPGWERVVRTRAWRAGTTLVFASSVLLVLVSRQRPLLPPPALTGWLADHGPVKSVWQRLAAKQEMQQKLHRRFDAFLPHLKAERLIGLAALSPGETSLWQPYEFGPNARRVFHVRSAEELVRLRKLGLRYVVQDDLGAMVTGAADGLDWARRQGGKVVAILGLSEAEVEARRLLPTPPTLDDIARNRPGPDGKPPVNVVYLVEWERL